MHSHLCAGDIIRWQQPTFCCHWRRTWTSSNNNILKEVKWLAISLCFLIRCVAGEGLKSENSESKVVGPKEIWYAHCVCMIVRRIHKSTHRSSSMIRWSSIHPISPRQLYPILYGISHIHLNGNVIGYSLHPVYLASWGSQVPNCFRHHPPLLIDFAPVLGHCVVNFCHLISPDKQWDLVFLSVSVLFFCFYTLTSWHENQRP